MYFGLFFFFFFSLLHEEANILSLGFISPTFSLKCAEEGGGPLKPNGTLLTPKCSYICGPFEEKRRTGGRRCRKSFRRGQRGLPNSFRRPTRHLIINCILRLWVHLKRRTVLDIIALYLSYYFKRCGCIRPTQTTEFFCTRSWMSMGIILTKRSVLTWTGQLHLLEGARSLLVSALL